MTRIKGQLTASEPLSYNDFQKLLNGLRKDGEYLWELYCIVSFCTACRVSDVKNIRWKEILNKNELIQIEQKTDKTRRIPINDNIVLKISEIYDLLGRPDETLTILYNASAGKPFTTEHINRKLKEFKVRYTLPIKRFSTHTFRKTFGRYVWESMGRTTEAITLLCLIFKHSNLQTTMVYLGIRQDEINHIFSMIDI